MNKQKFVAEILKAYDALKDQDTDSVSYYNFYKRFL